MRINQLFELDLGNYASGAEWKAAKDAQKNAGKKAGKQIAMNKQQSATSSAKPGTSVATTNTDPNLDKLEKAKQDALARNPQLAQDVQASNVSVQQSQQRANDPKTYQQNQAPEKNMGQADVVDVDAKEVPNQSQLEKPAVAPAQGAGAFSNIANQTTNPNQVAPQTSSTGGKITPTDTGLTHTAAANNPNQPQPTQPAGQKQPSGTMNALKKLGGAVAGGVGRAIKAAPGAVAGAAGSAVGGFAGGLKRGYQQQSSGGVAPTWNTPSGAFRGSSTGSSNNDIQALNARLANIEKRLGVTAEGKLQFESKFLGRKI